MLEYRLPIFGLIVFAAVISVTWRVYRRYRRWMQFEKEVARRLAHHE